MTSETRDQMIGAVVLLLLLALIGVLNQNRGKVTKDDGRVHVEALFGRVDGLLPGDDVYLSGVRVGSVVRERLDKGFRAVLTLALDDKVPVPKDSSAAIQTDGLFGSKFVVIQPGASDQLLKNGDRITLTQDAQVVEDLLEMIISEGRANLAARRAAAKAAGAAADKALDKAPAMPAQQ